MMNSLEMVRITTDFQDSYLTRYKLYIIYLYRWFIEINKHKKKLQIYIQQLMAAHIIVDNGSKCCIILFYFDLYFLNILSVILMQ